MEWIKRVYNNNTDRYGNRYIYKCKCELLSGVVRVWKKVLFVRNAFNTALNIIYYYISC